MDEAAVVLARFLGDVSDAPEVLWSAGIAMIERAAVEAREARHGRFRHYPQGQLRRLREELAQGIKLARLAVSMQEAEEVRDRSMYADLAEAAAEAGRARRRAQTLPAEQARLAKAKARRAG